MKIGFETGSEQGPGIFLSRLKVAFEKLGVFDAENPEVWIQLSFERLPDRIAERKQDGRTKIAVRMDGCYCMRHHKIKLPWGLGSKAGLEVPLLDDWYSAKVNWRKNTRIRENLLAADEIIFQSAFSRTLTQRFVIKTPPGVIINNGVPLMDFSPSNISSLPEREGTPDGGGSGRRETIRLIMSHSFQPYHRLHDGLKILMALKYALAPTPVHLSILGGDNANCFDNARQIATQLQLKENQDFTFLGKKPYLELGKIYREHDLMLNLSYWDTCPNVVVEALASGLPVIGVNHGGVAELVGQESNKGGVLSGGILVDEAIPMAYLDHANPQAMPQAPIETYVNAIQHALKNRAQLSQQARQRAQALFDIRNIAAQYLQALRPLAPET